MIIIDVHCKYFLSVMFYISQNYVLRMRTAIAEAPESYVYLKYKGNWLLVSTKFVFRDRDASEQAKSIKLRVLFVAHSLI